MISIIIPVYNCERYIEKTISCITNQTYKDWELICIDDGSTDRSAEILDNVSTKDERIIIIHQENQGAGAARNKGLEYAKGEFLIFLDADDYFNPVLLERLLMHLIDNDADVCLCNYAFKEGARVFDKQRAKEIPNKVFSLNELGDFGFSSCGYAPWNKLIRMNLITDNGLRFQNLSSSNDVYFSCMTLYKAKRIVFVPGDALVIYNQNREGQISKRRKPENLLYVVDSLLNEIRLEDYSTIRKIISILLLEGMYELRQIPDDETRKRFYNRIQQYIRNSREALECASVFQKRIVRFYLSDECATNWWTKSEFQYKQLDELKPELKSICDDDKIVILWGCGRRGRIFGKYCKLHGLKIYGVFDKDIYAIDYFRDSIDGSVQVMSEYEAISEAACIIASNSSVEKHLIEHNYDGRIINLENVLVIAYEERDYL